MNLHGESCTTARKIKQKEDSKIRQNYANKEKLMNKIYEAGYNL